MEKATSVYMFPGKPPSPSLLFIDIRMEFLSIFITSHIFLLNPVIPPCRVCFLSFAVNEYFFPLRVNSAFDIRFAYLPTVAPRYVSQLLYRESSGYPSMMFFPLIKRETSVAPKSLISAFAKLFSII